MKDDCFVYPNDGSSCCPAHMNGLAILESDRPLTLKFQPPTSELRPFCLELQRLNSKFEPLCLKLRLPKLELQAFCFTNEAQILSCGASGFNIQVLSLIY
jgi:hypothetical protein